MSESVTNYLSRPGTKFIAAVPPDTKLVTFNGVVIAAGPHLAPHRVTDDGLELIVPAPRTTKRGYLRKRQVFGLDPRR